jgi:transcriptional antiterminator NusG
VTEQNGHNPEVMQDVPPISAGGETEPEYAPAETAHEAPPAETAHESPPAETGADAAMLEEASIPSENADDDDGVESIVAVPVKPKPVKSESPKARKTAAAEAPVATNVPKSESMNWYILKVQSNREESIREGLLRRVAIQGLDRFFGEVIVPTEKVTEFKGGKKRVIKRKLYPGYLVVHMEINEDTWFLVRETPGIGDFTGASGIPTPMLPHEVERIVMKQEEKSEKAPDLKIPFTKGDRVKVIEGNFENFEGEVENIDKTNGRVTVMITIFNRTTPVEFEYWQVESL